MARPNKEFDKEQFEKLCELQCTKQEICSWFDTTDKTLERWCKREYKAGFSEVFAQKRGRGKIALRRMQLTLAKKSASMAIFLGKNWLGQTDHPIDEQESNYVDPLSEALRELGETL